MQVDLIDLAQHQIEDTTRKYFMPWIQPSPFPTGHDVAPLLHLFEEARYLLRIVLQIRVHREDKIAGALFPAGSQCISFAHISAKPDGFYISRIFDS